jgi:hypothetical protein
MLYMCTVDIKVLLKNSLASCRNHALVLVVVNAGKCSSCFAITFHPDLIHLLHWHSTSRTWTISQVANSGHQDSKSLQCNTLPLDTIVPLDKILFQRQFCLCASKTRWAPYGSLNTDYDQFPKDLTQSCPSKNRISVVILHLTAFPDFC